MKDWKKKNNKLRKEFIFNDFLEALDFVNKVGELAQTSDHHPDIHLISYKKVILELVTHNAGEKITKRDFELAEKINNLIK